MFVFMDDTIEFPGVSGGIGFAVGGEVVGCFINRIHLGYLVSV